MRRREYRHKSSNCLEVTNCRERDGGVGRAHPVERTAEATARAQDEWLGLDRGSEGSEHSWVVGDEVGALIWGRSFSFSLLLSVPCLFLDRVSICILYLE